MWWLNNFSKSDDVNEKGKKWLTNPSKSDDVNEKRTLGEVEKIITPNKINSSKDDEQNADYRYNMTRLREKEDILAWKLSDAIKWWWEIDLNDFIIQKPPENFILETKPLKQILPIIEHLPPAKQILPIITDMKVVNELPPDEN